MREESEKGTRERVQCPGDSLRGRSRLGGGIDYCQGSILSETQMSDVDRIFPYLFRERTIIEYNNLWGGMLLGEGQSLENGDV